MEDMELSLLRQSLDATDLLTVQPSSSGSSVLVFCSVCCKSAKQSQMLTCDHVACPAKYHLDCLRQALRQLHTQHPAEVILCPVCHKFETAAKEYASTGNVAVDEAGRARVNLTLATSVDITHEQERRLRQILQGTAIDMPVDEQIAYLSRHILPRTDESQQVDI